MLVHRFLETSADRYPDHDALVHLGERISYLDLEHRANRLANTMLESGVKSGDRVAVLIDSSINYVIAYFAILKAGAAVVALNTVTTAKIVRNVLKDCRPSAVIVHEKRAALLKEIIPELTELKMVVVDGSVDSLENGHSSRTVALDDVFRSADPGRPGKDIRAGALASIIYTSGTTGDPRGVMLSHLNLQSNTDAIVEYLHLTHEDKVMACLPFFYSYGNSLLLTHFRVGGTVVIDGRFAFPNVVLEVMSEEKVTGFSGVPSTFAILMHKSNFTKYNWDHLRYLTQAGGPMTPALTMKITQAVPQVKIFIMYGQTEASARLSYLEPDMLFEKIGSIGKAIPGVTLTVRDNGRVCQPGEVGEIVAQGDNIMMGYWNQPEATAGVLKEDGLHTGDLALCDDDGYLFIVSRKSDMIKSGAHRISPKEIEEALAEHDDIIESAVVGIPDEIMGEVIKAVVVLRSDSTATERDILRHCQRSLPPFKVPKVIEFRNNLPKTASGKVRRHVLREAG